MKIFNLFTCLLIVCVTLMCACSRQEKIETISFSTWGSQSELKIIKPIIKDFEEKNNIKIELLHIPQNYFQKLHLLYASKQAPDVVFINNYYLKTYADANLLEDLTPYFSNEDFNIFFPNALKSLSVDKKQYGIPRDISNMVVYYNKSLFDKKGIPYPNKNWTYDDFLNTAKKLTDKDKWGLGIEDNALYWSPILWSNNAEIFDENGNFSLNTKEAKDSLKYYIELKTIHKVAPNKIQSANQTTAQMFLNQKVAMQISGRWLVPKYREEAKFQWDIIPMPNGKTGSITSSDTSGWVLSKSAKNKELAVKFIKHLSSENSINKMTSSGLITPARKDSAYSTAFLDNKPPKNAKYFLDINKNYKITNIPKDYNKKIEKLNKILEPYFSGKEKITPKTKFEL